MLTRRQWLAALAAAPALTLARPLAALTEASGRALIDRVVAEINTVIASGASEAGMFDAFETIFRRYADTSYVAAYAMGADGRSASDAQKRAFTDAYVGYLARKYGRRFREFIGGRLEVRDVVPATNAVEVRTTAYLKGQAPFEVSFLVSDRTGSDLFFNMFVEGINMGLTERAEIGAMIDARGGDIDAMIRDLRSAG
ncbi:phospholipid transport system substrate-binding protein [Poseidonocella sedimentorum]|uniref:Phospholipid transport system substrate-binding protein n=1 Tax=Poseidonocella sedimentorum TaxID=871652 RepID=A0A1I6D848_9RHOB|nr:ABC transporter substrate-binding protein [Poseidonocella sedimentorum]SFR01619.1 phospholipid transport system substrate-binding protein [Poseidonocella sedimentorum]